MKELDLCSQGQLWKHPSKTPKGKGTRAKWKEFQLSLRKHSETSAGAPWPSGHGRLPFTAYKGFPIPPHPLSVSLPHLHLQSNQMSHHPAVTPVLPPCLSNCIPLSLDVVPVKPSWTWPPNPEKPSLVPFVDPLLLPLCQGSENYGPAMAQIQLTPCLSLDHKLRMVVTFESVWRGKKIKRRIIQHDS